MNPQSLSRHGAVVLMTVTLWGCTATQPTAPTGGTGTTAADGPVIRKVNRVVVAVEPTTAESNVLRQLSTTTGWPMFPMYEWLIDVDPATGKGTPQLATSWMLEPDGASYRFMLRKGVRFHGDFGEFTGQDFAEAVKEKTRPDAQGQSVAYWRQLLNEVQQVHDHEVVLRLKRPDSQFLDYVSRQIPGTEIFSKVALDRLGEPTNESGPLPGTAPYQFKERAFNQFIRYQRVPYQHWRVQPDFPELELRFVKEASTRLAALIAGEVHLSALPNDLLKEAQARGFKLVTGKVPGFRAFFGYHCCVLKNPQDPNSGFINPDSPLKDIRVRRALSKAINRDELNKGLFGGKGEIMYNTPFHPTRPGWDPSWQQRFPAAYGYDLAAAKALLAEAGYSAANPLTVNSIVYQTQGLTGTDDIIDAVANYWRMAGINVELVKPPSSQVLDSYSNHVYLRGTSSTIWGGVVNFGSNLASSGRTNMNSYEGDEVLAEIGRTVDETKIQQLWQREGEILFTQQKFIPLFWLPVELAVNPAIVADLAFPGSLTGNWTHLENVKAAR